jgi:hypothetical protein
VSVTICTPTIGASRTPATPANTEPITQLAVAIRTGEMPRAADAIEFSACAEVASPNRVRP